MVTIDLAEVSVREANGLIWKHGDAGEDVEVLNPDARHHIGVGLTSPIKVKIRGSAGYFCAGLTDQAHFEVENDVEKGVAEACAAGREGLARPEGGYLPSARLAGSFTGCWAQNHDFALFFSILFALWAFSLLYFDLSVQVLY